MAVRQVALLKIVPSARVHMHCMYRSCASRRTSTSAAPSERALAWLSLGYRELVADYYWLRAISHFGDTRQHAHAYPNLVPLTRRVLFLDPKFAGAYVFAGSALTVKGIDPAISVGLLQQGARERPDVWRVPYLLGFNLYYFLGQYGPAAEAMARAAKLDGAPDFVAPLATRLAAEAGEPEVGLSLIDSLLATVGAADENLRQQYQERRNLLLLEFHLKHLNLAADRFAEQQGRRPQNIQELVTTGLLKGIPPEPLGGAFLINGAGEVATTSETQRLRLAPEAKGRP